MQGHHLVDFTSQARPRLGGGPVLLRALTEAKERLEARENGRNHTDYPDQEAERRVHLMLECGEDARSDSRGQCDDGHAKADVCAGRRLASS
jgi:hypothetical protein